MAFAFKRQESVARGVHRIVRKEVDKALGWLNRLPANIDAIVHDVRKRFKKIRAALKLMRSELGEKTYERENTRFRDAGRPLTEVRDAKVLLDTFDDLKQELGENNKKESLNVARQSLKNHYEQIRQQVLVIQAAPKNIARSIGTSRRDISDWKTGHGWPAMGKGLRQGYRRASKAFAVAMAESNVENLHECHKRVKDLWHQLQLIEPAQSEELKEPVEHTHELAKKLGEDHGLFVLGQFFEEEPLRPGATEAIEKLAIPIAQRRAELQDSALHLGRQLLSDSPRLLIKGLKIYWKAWRTGPQPIRP